ncbi:MAG: hypothetical protein ACFFC7_26265 [Candidatus Hermodarchaeota archaeon]
MPEFEDWILMDENTRREHLSDMLKSLSPLNRSKIKELIGKLETDQVKLFHTVIFNLIWKIEMIKNFLTSSRNVLKQNFEQIDTLIEENMPVPDRLFSKELFKDSSLVSKEIFQEIWSERDSREQMLKYMLSASQRKIYDQIDNVRSLAEIARAIDSERSSRAHISRQYVSQVVNELQELGLIAKNKRGREIVPVKLYPSGRLVDSQNLDS